jgi:hypothetical protein
MVCTSGSNATKRVESASQSPTRCAGLRRHPCVDCRGLAVDCPGFSSGSKRVLALEQDSKSRIAQDPSTTTGSRNGEGGSVGERSQRRRAKGSTPDCRSRLVEWSGWSTEDPSLLMSRPQWTDYERERLRARDCPVCAALRGALKASVLSSCRLCGRCRATSTIEIACRRFSRRRPSPLPSSLQELGVCRARNAIASRCFERRRSINSSTCSGVKDR